MSGSFQIARVFGIPIRVNVSWFLTLAFITAMLALRFYPVVIPPDSPYRDDKLVHWVMAAASGLVFFASILLHELAHSVVAQKQGLVVKGITLFIFGGMAQITSEARRPLHEFVMALVGPLTSILLAGAFLATWGLLGGFSEEEPLYVVLEWLFLMNLIVGAFNLAPGFPMDGGRVLRSVLWGVTGNFYLSTRWVTLLGRAMGYGLMAVGLLATLRLLGVIDPWSGLWFFILGLFLESAARQSWIQARILETLRRYRADEIMSRDMETVGPWERVGLIQRQGTGGRRFILFVAEDERIIGVLTEKEVGALTAERRLSATAGEVMLAAEKAAVADPADTGARILEQMEAAEIWHLPVVSESRVIGVISKESLLRLLTRRLPQPTTA